MQSVSFDPSPPAGLWIARQAVRSLHAELMLYPKPGLVSAIDNGSHDDMNAALFLRSLFSLRAYFKAAAEAGAVRADFQTLQRLGVAAEARMNLATGGVNTHRGAIFCLGLLCAAAGSLVAADTIAIPGSPARRGGVGTFSATALQAALSRQWGEALALHVRHRLPEANGTRAAQRYGIGGARLQAAAGMPAVFTLALPALRAALAAGRGWECARIDAFFHLLARLDDSNVHHRGGIAGARLVRACGERFLQRGATANPHWRDEALASHRLLVAQRLSPGGAADLLAATCFVHAMTDDSMACSHDAISPAQNPVARTPAASATTGALPFDAAHAAPVGA